MPATVQTIDLPARGTNPPMTGLKIELRQAAIRRGPNYLGTFKAGDDGLSVQCFDAYGYQRELSVHLQREAGAPLNSRRTWVVHAYRHPGRREITEVSGKVARAFIERFWELTRDYPSLLFNETGEHRRTDDLLAAIDRDATGRELRRLTDDAIRGCRPCNEGFVRLHESLLDGAAPSVNLLR